MEEERYSIFVDDDDIAADEELDKLDWDRFPSFGPFSEEEAIARIEEAEKDLSDPSKWITSEQMWQQLYEEFPWLKTGRTEEPQYHQRKDGGEHVVQQDHA